MLLVPSVLELNAATINHDAAGNASAAAAIDDDFMVLGDDETQRLRMFRRDRSAPPIYEVDFSSELGLSDTGQNGSLREVDIEAAATLGSRIFWLGSHSNCGGCTPPGEIRINRFRLFATDIVGAGEKATLQYVGRYDKLRDDLIRWDRLNLHGKGSGYYGLEASAADGVPPESPKLDGFNIEGLAFNRDGRTAYLGFRAPMVPTTTRNHALVIPVLNIPQLVLGNPASGPAQFGKPIEWDLDGRGIRGLETFEDGLLIIGGAVTNGGSFRLYTWQSGRSPALREHLSDLELQAPEAILYNEKRPPGLRLQLVSDGSRTNAASQFVVLGEVVPYFLNAQVTVEGGMEFVVRGQPKMNYLLESSVSNREWIPVSKVTIPKSVYLSSRVQPIPGDASRYHLFRLKSIP